MTAALYTFVVRDENDIRDSMLRTQRNMLIDLGVQQPNLLPDSDEYVRAQALANELASSQANAVIAVDAIMPDTAGDAGLGRWGNVFQTSPRGAGASTGSIVFNSSQPSIVAAGLLLFDGAGLAYAVRTTATYNPGDSIPIISISKGNGTNLPANTPLQWQNPPLYSAQVALVAVGGLTQGTDPENTEGYRGRILGRFRSPPGSGNWGHVAVIAEDSYPGVQKAFVYPAVQGAGSVHVAVTRAPTATNKNRDIDSLTLNGTIIPYILNAFPGHAAFTITTVSNLPTDVGFGLSLPAAATAGGPGGGWLDASPWPTTFTTVAVTAVTSTTVFTVNAATPPSDGVSRIAYLSPTDWTLRTARVLSHTGTSGAYTITIDTPFLNIAVTNLIWPQAANQAAYVNGALAQFAVMGPGQKTANPSNLIRGYRRPVVAQDWPSDINATFSRALENLGQEVLSASIFSTSPFPSPPPPALIGFAPNIIVPNNIGFYPQ